MTIKTGEKLKWLVKEKTPTGYWLSHHQENLFLPNENAASEFNEGTEVVAIATHDDLNNPVADSRLPKANINKTCLLIAKDATARGAYFDCGMTRDLYIPSKWQETPINVGMPYLVHLFVDPKTERITGATKLRHFYPETSEWYSPGQNVTLTVFASTELGYKVLIDETVLGLLFHSDVSADLSIGDILKGVIKKCREDGKLDVGLPGETKQTRKALHLEILDDLDAHGGLSTLTDKSSPDDIMKRFGVSKGAYKKAIGHLFKSQQITINKNSIQRKK